MTTTKKDLLTLFARVWGALSLGLLLAGVFVGHAGGIGKTFFAMLNALNLGCLFLAFVFRTPLRKKIEAIAAETATQPDVVEQIEGETAIGLFFLLTRFRYAR